MWAETRQCSYNCEEQRDTRVSFLYIGQTLAETHKHAGTHLLYNSLPSRLSIELLVMLYDPIFTVRQYNKQRKEKLSRQGKK